MNQPSDKIIDRIRKLLALGSNNPNENEAAIAMKRAHRLLAEYNLSMADMSEKQKAEQDPYVRGEQVSRQRFRAHLRTIADSIGKLNFCKVFYTRSPNFETYSFVGRKTNVDIAIMVSQSVCDTICNAARASSSDAGFQTSFVAGAARRIYYRVEEMIAAAEKPQTVEEDGVKINLPALRSTYLAERNGAESFINDQLGIKLKKGSARKTGANNNLDGFYAGDRAGANVSLRPELGGCRSNAPALR